MYRLYGTLGTGTCAVHAALAEAGAQFDQIEITTKNGDHRTESYRRINPRQQVPSLQLPDGTIVTEGPAILLHIADAHPHKKLAPPPGSSPRSQHDRWLIYFAVNVYEGELRKLFGDRYCAEAACATSVQIAANDYVDRHYKLFEGEVAREPYFFGDTLTVLDIYVWMLSQWMDNAWLKRECPRINALAEAVKQRPSIAPIHRANFG